MQFLFYDHVFQQSVQRCVSTSIQVHVDSVYMKALAAYNSDQITY